MTVKKLLIVGLCAVTGACGTPLLRSRPMSEQVHRGADGSKFRAIVVIAGNDGRNDLRMSIIVRQDLTDAGITALRRAGRWGSEVEAIEDVCPAGSVSGVDGVLFVYYNQLTLFDCSSHARAYEISGGDTEGLPGMTKRLLRFLGAEKQAESKD